MTKHFSKTIVILS